jgi:CheW-like domain
MSEQPVFSLATNSSDYAQFLAQMNDAAFWEYAGMLSQEDVIPPASLDPGLLLCTLEDVSCLLPLHYLREILSAPGHYTALPISPPWMLGLMAWRGETIPILDLSAYLLQYPARLHPEDTLLITEHDHCFVGWLMKAVEAIPTSLLETDAGKHSQANSVWYEPLRSDMIVQMYTQLPLLDLALLISEATQAIGRVPFYDE